MRNLRSLSARAALVEGALVFGIFITIVLAIIEFGFFFMAWSNGRNGASEAAHEIAIAGRADNADYSALYAARNQLRLNGGALQYVIVYRAKNIKSTAPAACIAEAEAKKGSAPTTPVGVFDPGPAHAGKPVESATDGAGFPWNTATPNVACNIYYRSTLSLIPDQPGAFEYTVSRAISGDPRLSRFWPSIRRRDSLNGPVDFAGVYLKYSYTSLTGIIPSRTVNHNAVVQIEPRSTS
jgi:Flp pilus assembly protein TadG